MLLIIDSGLLDLKPCPPGRKTLHSTECRVGILSYFGEKSRKISHRVNRVGYLRYLGILFINFGFEKRGTNGFD
jgi:hypothetical protein